MDGKYKASVIIQVYNAAAYIKRTVLSIAGQSLSLLKRYIVETCAILQCSFQHID